MLIARFLRDRNGNISILAAIMLPVAIIGVGSAIDYTGLAAEQSKLRATADAAAVTAARSLFSTWGKMSRAERETRARLEGEAIADGIMTAAHADVDPSTLEHTVVVQISKTKELDFRRVLGLEKDPTLQTKVTATYLDPEAACVIALGPSESPGILLASQASIDAPKCGVWSNATSNESIRLRGSTELRGRKICAVGQVAATGGTDIVPVPKTKCVTFPDPYEGAAVSNNEPCKPPPSGNTLSPGAYCGGLTINSSVTLQPGAYEIRNGPLTIKGNITVQGSGVSILLVGTGAVLDISNNPTITLSAMTSGPLKGIVLASATAASPILTSQIHGSPTINLTGSIYLPTQRLDLDGGMRLRLLGQKDKLVALSMSLGPGGGSPQVTIDADDSKEFSPTGAIRLLQ